MAQSSVLPSGGGAGIGRGVRARGGGAQTSGPMTGTRRCGRCSCRHRHGWGPGIGHRVVAFLVIFVLAVGCGGGGGPVRDFRQGARFLTRKACRGRWKRPSDPRVDPSEQAWLMASEAWLHQVLERRHSRASSRGFDAMWRGQIRPTAEHRSMMRIRTEGLRVQWDSNKAACPSCSGRAGPAVGCLGPITGCGGMA